ncbi:carboxypeptidase [Duganella sp. Leaf126]|uniref:M14 family metallopeptidase n=1 Tax=Duganella sp. Leaf126 TaxID=1736266 RepID=UPI0006FD47BE|nr:M14 family metallopeptidase [Duganella sp. Leaf126]KQQ36255.1 carboxypeptidase [Duganella sp. Leaf126]
MLLRSLFFLTSLSVVASSAAAPSVAAPLIDTPPSAAPWHGKSERLAVPATDPLATPAERSGFQVSPTYAQTIDYLRTLTAASPLLSLHTFGRSFQGRELVYVRASKAATDKPGIRKPVVLVQAGIHSGEIDGKDAGLMLLRDIARRGRDDLLDAVDLVFIPILNVDGHESASTIGRPHQNGPQIKGARTNGQGLDLNRDYARLQSPEIAAVVKLLQTFDPALYIDVHVSDGIDYQYDVTYTYPGWGTYARSRATADWLMTSYHGAVHAALGAQGHVPDLYPSWVDEDAPEKGLRISAEGPRYSTGYGDFVGIPTVLVENHVMKPYKRRVLGTYVLLEQSLKTVARDSARIAAAKAQDRADRPAQLMVRWERDAAPLSTKTFKGYRYETYVSPVSGVRERRDTGEPIDIAMPVFGVRSLRDVALPTAWWISADQQAMIAALRRHGIVMEELKAPRTLTLEAAQLLSGKDRTAPQRVRKQWTLAAGSVRIPADQPFHLLAAALLEPESDDSFLANGWFDNALPFEAQLPRHLLAPLADRMMAQDPALRAAFAEALAADPALAGDPSGRLRWWLVRSPYLDRARWTYPVLAERP